MLLALFCALVEPALAASDEYFASIQGSSETTSAVDIPLYGAVVADPFLYVEAKVGEKTGLLRIATSHNKLQLSAEGQAAFGVKANKKGEGTLDSLSLGGLTLEKVAFETYAAGPDLALAQDQGMTLLGEIGITGIEGLSWAILPSAGVLRAVPAGDGAKLVSDLGATALDYTLSEDAKKKIGAGPKQEFSGGGIVVEGNFSGVKLRSKFAIDEYTSWAIREIDGTLPYSTKDATFVSSPLPAAPTAVAGEYAFQWRTVAVSGLSVDSTVVRRGASAIALYAIPSQIGQSVLMGSDIAIDTANHKLAVKAASSVKLGDYRATYEAALRKALEPAPVPEGEEAPSAEDQKKARAAAIPALADYLIMTGKPAEAVSLLREVTEVDANMCSSWLSYGEAALAAGQYNVAIEASTKAGELYDAWAKLSLAERTDLSKDYEKAKDKAAYTGPVPQSHACHVAWGNLAQAELASGNVGAVNAIYMGHWDLDANLAVVAGNALLLQGNVEGARAAFQQAATMQRVSDEQVRSGLILVHGSNWDLVSAQLQTPAGLALTGDAQSLRSYFAAAKKAGGMDAAVKAAQDLVAGQPGNVVLLVEVAQLMKEAGKSAEAASLLAEADKVLTRQEQALGNHPVVQLHRAQYLIATGKVEAARTLATAVVAAAPSSPDGYLVLADAYAALGNQEKATEFKKKAAAVGASFPVYATLAAK